MGIIDSVYLINLHYSSAACPGEMQSIGPWVIDCGGVAASDYSEIFGVPIALFGFLYYLTTFVVINFEPKLDEAIFSRTSITALQFLQITISIGFLVSLYLIYLQLGVLDLICSYCMVSALTTILKFSDISLLNFGITS